MLYLRDDGDNWSMLNADLRTITYEDGRTAPLTTKELVLEFPRAHKGTVLWDVDDMGLLRWLHGVAVEKGEEFFAKCFAHRMEELG